MTNLKIKRLLGAIGIIIFSFCFMIAWAVSSGNYTIILPAFKGDVIAMQDYKQTNDQFVYNKVISVGKGYKGADFWVTKQDDTRISNVTPCYPSNGTVMINLNNGPYSKGTYIKLYAQNHELTYVDVQLNGWADLK